MGGGTRRSRRDGHEPVELGGRKVGGVEPYPSESGGDRVPGVRPCGRGKEKGTPRPFRKPSDARPEGALDPSVDGDRLAERVVAGELCVGERRRQLDERERVPAGELEKAPPDRAVERDAGRPGEELTRVPGAQA